MNNTQKDFLKLAIELDALSFGDFTLKSGEKSPYFFNISTFFEKGHLATLASYYSDLILKEEIKFDVLFGPAYKGIPIASAIAALLSKEVSKPCPVCFDRKEEKDHGEGGVLIGDIKDQKVLVVDDVLTAGTALNSTVSLVTKFGGIVIGSIIGLDRQEKYRDSTTKDNLERKLNIPIYSIADLEHLIEILADNPNTSGQADKLRKFHLDK